MTFTSLSPLAVTAGILGLAGVLYLLQRLRVRHREIDVVTTLFWREAVQETRARVLVRRFRHPFAYLLVLLIASLLWFAFAEPKRGAEAGTHYVCLLDVSAGMGHGNRFAQTTARLVEVVDELPIERRRVLACGESARTLLAPGEETLLLEARLEGLAPRAAPASLFPTIERLLGSAVGETTVLVFGDAPLEEARFERLPGGTVQRVATGDDEREENRGITALGVSPAASGAWDAVDVLVELTGDELESRGEISVRLDGEAISQAAEPVRSNERGRTLLFRDVPARGQRLEVTLVVSAGGGDGLALDDSAAIRLPDRPLLRVGFSSSLDAALRPALEADPAVVIVDTDAELFLARAGEAIPAGVPVLRFVPSALQTESFLVTYDDDRDSEAVLFEVVGALGLEEIDSTGLAEAAERPITLGARPGAIREVAVWEELLGEGFDFVDSRSFPLFVARCLRWLSDTGALRSWAVAGEAFPESGAFTTADGRHIDPVGAAFTPPLAGDYSSSESGEAVAVALLSLDATEARALDGLDDPTAGVDGGGLDPVTWLLLLAGVLLVVEWALVRTGRMP